MESGKLSIIEQLSQLRITADSAIAPHEFLFEWNGTPCYARGELVAVTGKAKSGKTYLNSILMAEAGRDSGLTPGAPNKERLGLKRTRDEPMRVVWIDTEQSEDSTHEILRDRIGALIGTAPSEDLYHVFNLRQVRWQDRMELVLSAVAICKPDLVIFDGIRDVVGDINDYTEAQNTIGQLLRLASDYHTCIVCVLHQNKAVEDKTLRGALGTELQNKSFETYECTKNSETHIFSVKQTATRKYDMPNRVDFCVSREGLPMRCAEVEEHLRPSPQVPNEARGFNPEYVGVDGKIDKGRLFGSVLADGSLSWTELRTQIMQKATIRSPHFAETLMRDARDKGLLRMILINSRREYIFQCQQQLFDEDAEPVSTAYVPL